MKRPELIIASLGVVTLLVGCASPAGPRGNTVPQARYQPAEASDPYTQTAWRLVRWTHPDGRQRALPTTVASAGVAPNAVDRKSRPLTVEFFHQQGLRRISGSTSCNAYSADYTVANGNLILTSNPVVAAEICAPATMAVQADFVRGMQHIVSSSLDDFNQPTMMAIVFDNGDVLGFNRTR